MSQLATNGPANPNMYPRPPGGVPATLPSGPGQPFPGPTKVPGQQPLHPGPTRPNMVPRPGGPGGSFQIGSAGPLPSGPGSTASAPFPGAFNGVHVAGQQGPHQGPVRPNMVPRPGGPGSLPNAPGALPGAAPYPGHVPGQLPPNATTQGGPVHLNGPARPNMVPRPGVPLGPPGPMASVPGSFPGPSNGSLAPGQQPPRPSLAPQTNGFPSHGNNGPAKALSGPVPGFGAPGMMPMMPPGSGQQQGAPPPGQGLHHAPAAQLQGVPPTAPGQYLGAPPLAPGQLPGPPLSSAGQYPGAPPVMPGQFTGAPGKYPPPSAPGQYQGAPSAPGHFPSAHTGPGQYQGGGPPASGQYPGGPPASGQYPSAPSAPGQYPSAPAAPGQYPGAPAAYPEQSRRTLDPDQMPSPINVMEEDQHNNGGYFDTKDKGQTPPLVTTKFVVRDCGNVSPRFMRSTMYNVPTTPDMLKQTCVPFGLVISPFAPVEEGELEPPVSEFGASGPVRCVRCKAYMCPYMQFIDGGRRFQCVFCKATTEVPQEYFQHLDHNGFRIDHFQRPELCLGAYEVVATRDYCRDSKEPNVPAIIFAIDVSYPMIKEGVVQLICENMKTLLKHLPSDMNCDREHPRVGFMTYDNKVHFYNINKGLSQPQQLNVGDVGDMFVPLVEGFLVHWEEAEGVIDALVEQIPLMFAETRETETVLGPVIQAGKEAFKAAQCAGKLIVFHHNLPVAEAPGKLKNRDDRKVLGTEKEKTVLVPQTKFYNELGQECVAVGCSVDLFLFNNAYIDVATLSQVSRLTGGQVYKYTYFQPQIDGERFLKDLERNLSRPVVFDAIMRVRTSTGVRPVEFYGSFYMANTTDTELASINADAAIACEIKHDDKLTEEDGVYVQAAILFTSCSGQRRLRVLNLALNTGTSLADMYRNCELDTIVNFTAKQSISRLMETNPKTVKEHLINSCANILACYRKNCASPSSAGQLILPECMKLLPLYTNCLVKSDAISGGSDVGCDDRAYLMNAVSSMDVSSTVIFFYPRLFPIHDLRSEDTGLPNQIRCTIEKVRDDGVYLLENGMFLFMYIGLAVDPTWVQDVFGVRSAVQINVDQPSLEVRDNPVSRRIREVIDLLRDQHSRFMRLVLVRQREKLDVLFRHYLCEDRSGNDGNFSYVDFLCHMHKEIRALLG